MEREEIKKKAIAIKNLATELMEADGEDCFLKANARSIFAHARLLCNELGLDVADKNGGKFNGE